MSVRVKLSTLLRQAADWQEIVEVNGETPMDCLRSLEKQFPEIRKWVYDKNGNMWDRLLFFLNGEMIRREQLTSPMKDGDELYVLLNIGGG